MTTNSTILLKVDMKVNLGKCVHSIHRFGLGCEVRLINWFKQKIPKHRSIVDIGCGNGTFLNKLHEEGYANLCGIDYSLPGIHLAQSKLSFECPLLHIDLLDEVQLQSAHLARYDVVFDKGTFDAISLQNIGETEDRIAVLLPKYVGSIKQLLSPDGSFIITSCNWNMIEMVSMFKEFSLIGTVPHRTFTYGSLQGQDVSTCIFSNK